MMAGSPASRTDLVTVVWMGFDTPQTLGDKQDGAHVAGADLAGFHDAGAGCPAEAGFPGAGRGEPAWLGLRQA